MFKTDAREAVPIVDRTLALLLTNVPSKGRPGADLRNAIGQTRAYAERLLMDDAIGWWLDGCFELARLAGVTRLQFGALRHEIGKMNAVSAGAITIKNALLQFTLAADGSIIADTTFRSRWDVDDLKIEMNAAFPPIEEAMADSMDSMTYRALIMLRAAITNYLVETARPMSRMLKFQFADTMPSLVMSHRLYGTAARADELRYENKCIHPGFMVRVGRALSR